jgi:hypothetical protein
MDEIRIGQLTKEMVAEELRQLGDPCAKAAAVVRKTLAAALSGDPPAADPKRVIEDAVKGAMTALLLADQNLTRGAMQILETVSEAAAAGHLDPTEAMCAALKGLSDLRRFAEPSKLDDIRHAIESRYMGAGEVFAELLREPLPPQNTPPAAPRPR